VEGCESAAHAVARAPLETPSDCLTDTRRHGWTDADASAGGRRAASARPGRRMTAGQPAGRSRGIRPEGVA